MSLLDSAAFTARLKDLKGRAEKMHSSILAWNDYVRASELQPLFSQLSRGLHLQPPFHAEDPARGWSPVQTDDLPRPLEAIPGDCGECWLAYPDRPDHYRLGELVPARRVTSPTLATELTRRSESVRAGVFVEELTQLGPYGEAGPDGFQPMTDDPSGQTGVPLEQWDPESGLMRTVYPLGVDGSELIMRIGEVTNRLRTMTPTFGRLVDVGDGVIEIETVDAGGEVIPHGYTGGDELDVLAHIIGGINVLGTLTEGAMSYLEFYQNDSVTPIGDDYSQSVFKIVARAAPNPVHGTEELAIGGEAGSATITVIEFAIGQDILESSRNLEAALRTVPGITSLCLIQRIFNQIVFFPRNALPGGGNWTRTIGGLWWSLRHAADIWNYQGVLPWYPGVWYDTVNEVVQGGLRETVRIGRALPVVVISASRIRVAVGADWLPLSMVALARVRKAADDDLDVPYALLRPVDGAGQIDYESLCQNLVAAIKQSSAYGRYMSDFLSGVGSFTYAYSLSPTGDKITGLGLAHPAGVEFAGSKGGFRVENFYWSVPAGDEVGVSIPGALAMKGDGPYRLLRRGVLRTLTATVTGRFRCQLYQPADPDLASAAAARLGLIVLDEAEVGAELFLGTGQLYSYAAGVWTTVGHQAGLQWMLRPYLRLSGHALSLQVTSKLSEQSDQQIFYGPPVAIQDWCGPGVNEPFASILVTPTPVYLALELRDGGPGQLWLNLTVQRGSTGKRATGLTGFLRGSLAGRFGLTTRFCTPPLMPDGINANSQTQSIQFEELRLLAPTGRFSATYNGEGARRLELHPGQHCFAQLAPAIPEPRRVSQQVALLPSQRALALDDAAPRPSASLSFVGFPDSGCWLELTLGGHHYYYLLTSDPLLGALRYGVLIARSGPRLERLAQLTDRLCDRLAADANLKGLVDVSRQSLASWGSEVTYIQLRAARPGPYYNIRLTLRGADRAGEIPQSQLRLLYQDYRSQLRVLPQNLSLASADDQFGPDELRLGSGELSVVDARVISQYYDQEN